MLKRNDAFMRDSDLDHRPFGDSHFGDAGHNRRRLERLRPFAHEAKEDACCRSEDLPPSPTSSIYSWHEGFFEDLALDDSMPKRAAARRRAARPERPAGEG
ncbi:MAG: hypothetical protein WCQ45_00990 [bacterium]